MADDGTLEMLTISRLNMSKSSAIIQGDYRYTLTRDLGPPPLGIPGIHPILFIMLNPSTADADIDDPTIRRCMGFARRLGGTTLYVENLFAYRATSPKKMMEASDPVGPENDSRIRESLNMVNWCNGIVICAWGTNGSYKNRDQEVLKQIRSYTTPMCLGKTKHGFPKHPLYLHEMTPVITV
jgi:hypothetical protein